MANGALIVLVAATLVLLFSAGDVDGEDRWPEEQVLTFYIPGPAKVIVGQGTGSTALADTAYGSLSVFDVAIREGLENTSKSIGRCRGSLIIDNYDGTNGLNLLTINFTSHAPLGSVVIAGDFNTLPKSVLPIIGGTGEFTGVEGYLLQEPIRPKGPATRGQILDSTVYSELHYKLHRP